MTLTQSVLATLAYHDIFDYPLKEEEIHQYLVGKKVSLLKVKNQLEMLSNDKKIVHYSSEKARSFLLYALRRREKIFKIRILRTRYSQNKLQKAKFYTNLLKLIPTIRLVAISGALAMENSHKDDDVDLVIICAQNTLWTTRFLANLILLPFRRYPQSKRVAGRACLNIFIDESELKIRPQDLYAAHEICQMKPLWDREGTYSRVAPVNANTNIKRSLSVYSRFIKANQWVSKYLPNWTQNDEHKTTNTKNQKIKKALVISHLALVVEIFLKKFQLWYMRSKISNERIGERQLFFHPANTQDWVLKEYQKRLSTLSFPRLPRLPQL